MEAPGPSIEVVCGDRIIRVESANIPCMKVGDLRRSLLNDPSINIWEKFILSFEDRELNSSDKPLSYYGVGDGGCSLSLVISPLKIEASDESDWENAWQNLSVLGCDDLEDAHLDWIIDQSDNDQAPAVLSPFLPSSRDIFLSLFSLLDGHLASSDVMLDIGCGDGRVVLAACLKYDCFGIGIDISENCIRAAGELQDRATKERRLRTAWLCGDCVKDSTLIRTAALDFGVTICYLYVYPTLLRAIRPQIEELSRNGVQVITARYHFDEWNAITCVDEIKLLEAAPPRHN